MRRAALLPALLLTACPMPELVDAGERPNDAGDTDVDGGDPDVIDASPSREPIALPAYEQREGDPDAGYLAMINNPYVGCGVPESAYNFVFGDAPDALRLPGREGRNATLPYDQTQFETASEGVSVVAANCLFCHAAPLPGPQGGIMLGLGNANLDFTADTGGSADLAGLLVNDPTERIAYEKWRDRVVATAPYLITRTVGVNPADNLAGILFAHRDPETLAWSPTPLLDPPATEPTPTDVPPWWLMSKKHVMFYTGSGHGDHARIQMTASTLCVDTVDEAQTIDTYFPDIRAWIASLAPPVFPGEVDQGLADTGEALFEAHCAHCHGTYGEQGDYPNLLIPVAEVGTDALLATGSSHFDMRFTEWFNASFYGEIASLEPGDGYIAPPLDGIWATAPYLHNASVPTLRTLLDSGSRPLSFERATAPSDYDLVDVGWPWEPAPLHSELPEAERTRVYDTTWPGYGNSGHTYGDALSDAELDAVIEYLKTL